MPKFRKRPLVIEAVQYTGHRDNAEAVFAWVTQRKPRTWGLDAPFRYTLTPSGSVAYIKTPEGPMTVSPGDWIIQGINQEFYACKPDVFAQTYEPVDDSVSA